MSGTHGLSLRRQAAVAVEELQLNSRPDQRLVLMLAAEIDQTLAELLEDPERGELAVHVNAVFAVSRDRAFDEKLAGTARAEAQLFQPLSQPRKFRDIKQPFNDCFIAFGS